MNARDHLAKLDVEVEEAQARYSAALDTLRRQDHHGTAVDVLTPLYDYHHGVETRQREPDPAELRRLTADACERIVDEGLVLAVPTPGQAQIVDPSFEDEVRNALAALNAARDERDEYEAATRDERQAEVKKAEADKIKQALTGDDPDAIREALTGAQGDGPLTSADLEAGNTTPRPATGNVFHVDA